jgi:hypothetical protein
MELNYLFSKSKIRPLNFHKAKSTKVGLLPAETSLRKNDWKTWPAAFLYGLSISTVVGAHL